PGRRPRRRAGRPRSESAQGAIRPDASSNSERRVYPGEPGDRRPDRVWKIQRDLLLRTSLSPAGTVETARAIASGGAAPFYLDAILHRERGPRRRERLAR